jgi:L-cysteine S-thiosulfotransferase
MKGRGVQPASIHRPSGPNSARYSAVPEHTFWVACKSRLYRVFRASKVGLPDNGLCAFQHLYSHKKSPETLVIPSPRTALAALALLTSAGFAHAQSGAADGQKIAFDRGKGNCLTCHQIKGGDSPGSVGPALIDIRTKYPNRNDLIGIVSDETTRNPLTLMPPFGRNRILTEKEIDAIVDFLQTL